MANNPIKDRLNQIYSKIPNHNCKKCGECCGIIFWSYAEELVIREFLTEKNIPYRKGSSFICPYLLPNKECEIYPVRPTICRLQGVTEGMPCPENSNQSLTQIEGFNILTEINEIARPLNRMIEREKEIGGLSIYSS